jgi:hypothetical protein
VAAGVGDHVIGEEKAGLGQQEATQCREGSLAA